MASSSSSSETPVVESSVSPSSFTYPFAAAPDISNPSPAPILSSFATNLQPFTVRSNQKDAYYQGLLYEKISTILRNIYGARIVHKYSLEAKTLAELLYLGLTTLRNTRTLGEEYCDIVQVSSNGQRAPRLKVTPPPSLHSILYVC
jgi:peroxin-10